MTGAVLLQQSAMFCSGRSRGESTGRQRLDPHPQQRGDVKVFICTSARGGNSRKVKKTGLQIHIMFIQQSHADEFKVGGFVWVKLTLKVFFRVNSRVYGRKPTVIPVTVVEVHVFEKKSFFWSCCWVNICDPVWCCAAGTSHDPSSEEHMRWGWEF